MSNLGIYKLNFDCGRMGELTGVFVADKDHVKTLIEHQIEVYFGEVLGKHSEVYGSVTSSEISLASDDQKAIGVVKDLQLETGYNPFQYTFVNFKHESIEIHDDMTVLELVKKLIDLNG